MSDNLTIEINSKQVDISDLKVTELKTELKKRGLSTTGIKQELYDKLKNFLINSETNENVQKSPVKSPKKRGGLRNGSLNETIETNGQEETVNEEPTEPVKEESTEAVNEEQPLERVEDEESREPSRERSESVIKEIPLSGDRNRLSRSKSPKARWHQDEEAKENNHTDSGETTETSINTQDVKPERKRKWTNEETLTPKSITISSDTLKDYLPTNPIDYLDQVSSEEKNLEVIRVEKTIEETQVTRTVVPQEEQNELDYEENVQETLVSENGLKEDKIDEIIDEKTMSNVLHISNLTRPFTLNQLKELLSKHGKIREEHFWINSVKSHCYVEYESKSDAKVAKENLHNLVWPSSNPKQLVCKYSTIEELVNNMNGEQAPSLPKKDEKKVEEKEGEHQTEKKEKIREWDLPKLRKRSRSRERRHVEEVKKEIKKERKEEEIPKTLDDLFLKTTTTPFVYWLPLTEEKIAERKLEDERREVEREKRAEERRKKEEVDKAQREKERQEREEKEEKVQKVEVEAKNEPERERSRDRDRNKDRYEPRRDVDRNRYNRYEPYRRRTPPRYENNRYDRNRGFYENRYRQEPRGQVSRGPTRRSRSRRRTRSSSSSSSSSRSSSSSSSRSSSSRSRSPSNDRRKKLKTVDKK